MISVISSLIIQVITKLNAGMALLSNGIAVSSSNPLPVGGKSVQKSASFTRPAEFRHNDEQL